VRFAGWMIGINAFFLCLGGVLLLFVRPETSALEDAGLRQGFLQAHRFRDARDRPGGVSC
jgi:hypothetical protein